MTICELLPWFVAGTLDEVERREVLLHLGTCVLCRRELAYWRVLVPRLQAEIDSMPSSPPSLQNTSERLAHALVRDVLRLVPFAIPSVSLCTAEVAFKSPAGVMSIARLSVPRVRSQNIADWLYAAAGN